MALTQRLSAAQYDTLFKIVGEFVEVANRFDGLYAAFDTDISEIEAELNTEGLLRLYEGVPSNFNSFRSSILGWIGTINGRVANILTDKILVADELLIGSASGIGSILAELIRDMNEASEIGTASVVTVGAITSELDNTDPGSLLLDTTLDGVNTPATGVSANPQYNALVSQLSLTSDNLRVTCTADTNGGLSAYTENFQIYGEPTGSPWSHLSYGSGTGPSLVPLHSQTLLSGLQFTSFVANVPASWTITSGAAGTEILSEATEVYEGATSLELDGTSTDATLTNAVTANTLVPLKRYLFAAYIKSDGLVVAGDLEIMFTGTGYTAGSTEKVAMNTAALNAQTTFGLETFYLNAPAEIPTDLKLSIDLGSASAGKVYIDFMAFGEVTYWDGVNWAIVSGTDPYVVGDEFRLAITNDNAGVFQTYFRKQFLVQIPTGGVPTILDAWAT